MKQRKFSEKFKILSLTIFLIFLLAGSSFALPRAVSAVPLAASEPTTSLDLEPIPTSSPTQASTTPTNPTTPTTTTKPTPSTSPTSTPGGSRPGSNTTTTTTTTGPTTSTQPTENPTSPTTAEDAKPPRVTGLRAQGELDGSISLRWNPVPEADYYAVFHLQESGTKGIYKGISYEETFRDQTPEPEQFNFYRVFAIRVVDGRQIYSPVSNPSYVYAFSTVSQPPAVQNLRAATLANGDIYIEWDPSPRADYYAIYYLGTDGKLNEYQAITKANHHTDRNAVRGQYNFYRVYAYRVIDGKRVFSPPPTPRYTYAQSQVLVPQPGPVQNLRARALSSGMVAINWDPPAGGASYYAVYSLGTDGKRVNYMGISYSNEYVDQRPTQSRYNFYRVFAVNERMGLQNFSEWPDPGYCFAFAQKTPQTGIQLRDGELGIGQVWEVPGLWWLRVTGVTRSDYRNPYWHETPADVVTVYYEFENLGYDTDGNGLYLTPESILDAQGYKGQSYPSPSDRNSGHLPIGGKSHTESDSFGLETVGNEVVINFMKHDPDLNTKYSQNFRIAID